MMTGCSGGSWWKRCRNAVIACSKLDVQEGPISAYSTGSDAWRSFVGVQKNADVFFKLMQALGAGEGD